ncbi:MAG TPA: aminotransferase class IV [Symbiobacteriaceae bacterium]|jgi:aminodeoxychorismate lyase
MTGNYVWAERNGKPGRLVPDREVTIALHDRGFWYGDGVFETVRVWGGTLPLLPRHLQRLEAALAALGFPALSVDWKQRSQAVVQANQVSMGYLRLAVSRGEGPRGFLPPADPQWLLLIEAGDWAPAVDYGREGMRAALASWRVAPNSPLAHLKSLSGLDKVLAKQEATRLGVDEVLFVNTDGHLTEGASSSLFLVRGGRLCTPALDCGLLPGIARAVVLDLAGLSPQPFETRLTPEAILEADEAFLCNALAGVIPLVEFAGQPIGGRSGPGPVTLALRRQFEQVMAGRIY